MDNVTVDYTQKLGRNLTGKEVLQILVDHLNHGRSGIDLWIIISALRGPDSEDTELKNLTTARLRGLLGLTDNMTININNDPINDALKARRNELMSKGQPHFSYHYRMAVTAAINLLGYDLWDERKD